MITMDSKFFKRAASLGLALMLLLSAASPGALAANPQAASVDGASLTLQAKVLVSLDTASEGASASVSDDSAAWKSSAFALVLTPDDPAYPVPDETSVTIQTDSTGFGTAALGPIAYTGEGRFTYTIKQEPKPNTNYTCDPTVYCLTVQTYYISGELKMSCFVTEKDKEDKLDAIVFNNTYTEPEPEPTTTPTPDPDPDPDPIVTPTPSPSPSVSPSPSPEPSEEPTEEPTPEPEPSEEPTPEPTPSEEPEPEPTPNPWVREDDEPVKVPPDHEEPVVMDELPDPNDPDSPNYVTIIDEGVPKTYMKTEDPETGEMIYVWIEDEEVPIGDVPQDTPTDGSPKTGDDTDRTLWITMLWAAGIGLAGCVVYLLIPKKRKH